MIKKLFSEIMWLFYANLAVTTSFLKPKGFCENKMKNGFDMYRNHDVMSLFQTMQGFFLTHVITIANHFLIIALHHSQ